jgi:hypothetical protein
MTGLADRYLLLLDGLDLALRVRIHRICYRSQIDGNHLMMYGQFTRVCKDMWDTTVLPEWNMYQNLGSCRTWNLLSNEAIFRSLMVARRFNSPEQPLGICMI